jgi:phage shock protein A
MNHVDQQLEVAPAQPLLKPPAYGEAARDAVKSIMDGLATEMATRITDVRKRTDALEQTMLGATAEAKENLADTITVLQSVGDECARLSDVLETALKGFGATGHRRNGS